MQPQERKRMARRWEMTLEGFSAPMRACRLARVTLQPLALYRA
jgi:hypothetical protein